MRAWLSALLQRLFGPSEPTPTSHEDRPIELIQAAEEARLARKREADWEQSMRERENYCRGASAWARDCLEQRETLTFPSRMPANYQQWLRGLNFAELQIVGRQPPHALVNHVYFSAFYRDQRITGLPKFEALPKQTVIYPPPFSVAQFERGRGGGGGPSRNAGRDLRELAARAPKAVR